MHPYALVHTERFPLVWVEFQKAPVTTEGFQHYLDELSKIYDRKEKLAVVFDATNASIPGLKQQRAQAKWLKDFEQPMKDYCLGTAYIIPNKVISKVLDMIFSFQGQPVPYKVFNTKKAAESWAQQRLEEI